MDFSDRYIVFDEPFFKIELSPKGSLIFITYEGSFDFEQYKRSCLLAIELFESGKAQNLISEHRHIEVLPREAQKWFTGELVDIIKRRLGKDLDKFVFVAITLKKDPVRNVVAGFLAYMVNLFIGARFHYANSLEEALAYCNLKIENENVGK